MSTSRQIIGLIGWLLLSFAAAAIGAVASAQARAFYAGLVRPAWAPPGWLFAPVWTVLYALMGVAAWRVWRAGGSRSARSALVLFVVQLAVNALWSWIFFVWHRGAYAFVEILLLWCLIVATLAAFRRHNAMAAVLLLPYLAWVSFAALLALTTWRLNPNLL